MAVDKDIVMLEKCSCEAIRIKGDGNCLFASIDHQIFGFTVNSIDHTAMTIALREMVVQHIGNEKHDRRYRLLITTRVADEFPEIVNPSEELLEIFYWRWRKMEHGPV